MRGRLDTLLARLHTRRRNACVRRCAWACALLIGVITTGCASAVPKGRYQVTRLDLRGTERMDEAAIKACLATTERERTGFTLGGAAEPTCGQPPFDASRLPVRLWAWPWTDRPLYDAAIFDRDLDRIERWYRARGFYEARVVRVKRVPRRDDREIDLTVTVEEGKPVYVGKVTINGIDALDAETRARLKAAIGIEVGHRFDEALYDEAKRALLHALRDASYAKADVQARVVVDPPKRRAAIELDVALGPSCRFGRVSVAGHGDLSARAIWGAADLREGAPFSVTAIEDARRAVYALGSFASVELEEKPREDSHIIDIVVKVVPGRVFRFGVGAGLQVGNDSALTGGYYDSDENLNQWDVHLLFTAEHRDFLGGMRRLSVEERPRLIFNEPFPKSPAPELGNLLVVELRQPAFAEPRTTLVFSARWDLGPDPYGGEFSRSDVVASLGPERRFLNGRLAASITVNANVFLPDAQRPYPDYASTYIQYAASYDLRDVPRSPTRGAYFALNVQHAGYLMPGDWDYVRVLPEARGYLPLPLGIVFAGRVRLGLMEITHSDIAVPADDPAGWLERLRDLGPLRTRLRGGGQNSVRGYDPNTLGDVTMIGTRLDSGGLRQWEASAELRVPITSSFGSVLFIDVGDVSRDKEFRLQYPQTSLGIGLRYHTIVGPLRLDVGFAPPNLQTIGPDERKRAQYDADGNLIGPFPESKVFGAQGSVHFTIGEAF